MKLKTILPAICVLLPSLTSAQVQSPKSQEELLADLKGLHLPDGAVWWPPAPGWWGVLVIAALLVYGLYRWLRKRRQKAPGHWKHSALEQHETLVATLQDGAPLNEILAQASVLMRKVALANLSRSEAAAVQDDAWLALLDSLSDTRQYSDGVGKLLLSHPYRRDADTSREEVEDLLILMRKTITTLAGGAGRV